MNTKLFDELMKQEGRLAQHPPEWQMFLGICEMYLKKQEIKNPIVVELGALFNIQKRFYEQLFGAEHIGIDFSTKRSIPDIHGDTHNPETLKALKKKLGGRPINILFIDACHHYEDAKKDFEMYSPLCSDIVVFHDIETGRYSKRRRHEVWKLWDELKEASFTEMGKYENFLFLSIHQCRFKKGRDRRLGIGMMVKR